MKRYIACPDCEAGLPDEGELEVVRLTDLQVRETQPVELTAYPGGIQDTEQPVEAEQEVMDADRDGAEFRCESCGFTTDSPDDFDYESEEPDDA